MINKLIQRTAAKTVSKDYYMRKSRQSDGYLLVFDNVMQDRWTIYWRYESWYLKNGDSHKIHCDDFPWEEAIHMTYDEIKNIHKNSRYVLTADIPKHMLRTDLRSLLVTDCKDTL